jgi:hypothetical protein
MLGCTIKKFASRVRRKNRHRTTESRHTCSRSCNAPRSACFTSRGEGTGDTQLSSLLAGGVASLFPGERTLGDFVGSGSDISCTCCLFHPVTVNSSLHPNIDRKAYRGKARSRAIVGAAVRFRRSMAVVSWLCGDEKRTRILPTVVNESSYRIRRVEVQVGFPVKVIARRCCAGSSVCATLPPTRAVRKIFRPSSA